MPPKRLTHLVLTAITGLYTVGLCWADSQKNAAIAPQSLTKALTIFAEQTGLQLVYPSTLTIGLQSKGATAGHAPRETLDQLLANTGLRYTFINERTVSIETQPNSQTMGEGSSNSGSSRTQRTGQTNNDDAEVMLEEIYVTGTRIAGVSDQFSPVSSFTREDIDAGGFASVGDLIGALPQNFGGGVSTDTQPAGSSFGAGAQTVNLRGVGAESTLTLLNGRRLAPGGLQGSFVDISAIPLSAIKRVEVLTDGASAIYGADAIAGVVNVILREDYEGAETRLRVGTAMEGDGTQRLIGQTLGKTWDTGRALISMEYAKDNAIDSNDKDFSAGNPHPDELLPLVERQTLFSSVGWQIFDNWDLSVDAYYNDRKTDNVSSFIFFGNPAATTTYQNVEIEQLGGTLAVGYDINNLWRTELSASIADSKSRSVTNSTSGSNFSDESDTRIESYEITVGGPLSSSNERSISVLFGTQQRREEYTGTSLSFPDTLTLDIDNNRRTNSVFGELYMPLVDNGNSRPGLRKLAFNIAVRYENYSDVGDSTNPKIGVVYAPLESLTFRGTYGTSFRAPLLAQLIDQISFTFISDYLDPTLPGGQGVGLFVSGSTRNLDPETATSWTFGFDYEPTFLPAFSLRATYFNIDYKDRVAQAFPSYDPATNAYFGLPIPIDVNPAPDELAAFVAASPTNLNFTETGATLADVTVFGDLRQLNTSSTLVDGIDLTANFDLATDNGNWSLSLDASYLLNFEQQFSELTPTIELVNTLTHPVDLRIRGGVSWSRSGWLVSSFINYVDNYKDDQVLGKPVPINSWTTVDFTTHFDLGYSHERGFLRETSIQLSIRNLFDRDPPATQRNPGTTRFGYDAANADPYGRTVSVQLTKRW